MFTGFQGLLHFLAVSLLVGAAHLQAAVVLQYHHISDTAPAATRVTPARFAEHMAYLADQGFEVVALPVLVEKLRKGEPLPDKAAAITFDDGYSSVYSEAFPLLKKRKWPFTVFVNPPPLDKGHKQFTRWEQLREMAKSGATIANHSMSHSHLIRLKPGESQREWKVRVREEILAARRRIVEETGQDHRLFAYPYGEYNRPLAELLQELDYIGFAQFSGPLSEHADLRALPRFPFGGDYGDAGDFAAKVNSLPMPVESVELRSEKGNVLADVVLPLDETRPQLVVKLTDKKLAAGVRCFASGQGAIKVAHSETGFIAQAPAPLSVGRSRYNCTANSGQAGRFYWYSQQFIRKREDGSWYVEK